LLTLLRYCAPPDTGCHPMTDVCRYCHGSGYEWVVLVSDPDEPEKDVCAGCKGKGVTP
jgi:DnaJ-class molecular chaperone